MDIYSPPGTKVKFKFPNAGYDPDVELAAKHLKIGATYTVARTTVHRSSTDVELVEHPGILFNSAHFS